MAQDKEFYGTECKYLVEIVSPGFDMESDEFEVALTKGSIQRVFHKNEMIEEVVVEEGVEKKNYYLCFDTREFGNGIITATIVAHVPDSDFDDGIRDEVEEFELMTVKGTKYRVG